MNVRTPETISQEFDSDGLNEQRRELLDYARSLDYLGRRFERFVSMQLQQLEVAIDDFQRERAAWQRQRDRELERIREQKPQDLPKAEELSVAAVAGSSAVFDSIIFPDENGNLTPSKEISGSASAPLKLYMQPGTASALQIGLILFEISKVNRELGGGGVRFEVGVPRVPKKPAFGGGIAIDEPGAILCLEAFSCLPLLTYDGRPTRQLQRWDYFKSQVLMSSMIDQKLGKLYEKGHDVPREHEVRELALEATRRADLANCKVDSVDERFVRRFRPAQKEKSPTHQQLERVEQVVHYLKKDCGLLLHLSLV